MFQTAATMAELGVKKELDKMRFVMHKIRVRAFSSIDLHPNLSTHTRGKCMERYFNLTVT